MYIHHLACKIAHTVPLCLIKQITHRYPDIAFIFQYFFLKPGINSNTT